MLKILALFVATAVLVQGEQSTFKTSRIVGGVDAIEGSFPYQASLQVNGFFHTCGGSVISSRTILTAGHCVKGKKEYDYEVFVGSVSLGGSGKRYYVEKLILHEDYNGASAMNDIGLVITIKRIDLNIPSIRKIEPETKYIGAGVNVTLTGWGLLGNPGFSPEILQVVNLKTISSDDCIKQTDATASDICTFTKKGEGSCSGDSGGPLVADGKQVGIVSRGYPCAIGRPDIFTRVSTYIDWINKNIVD